jgi:hypothetical protein
MIPDAREVRLKMHKVLEARCRTPTTAQRARIVLLAGSPAEGRTI